LLLAIALPTRAQNLTTTSATVVDNAGTAYTFGTYTVTLVNTTTQQPQFGGNTNFQKTFQGGLDTNGFFSLALPSVTVMSPSPGLQWSFFVCANPQAIAYEFPKPALPCFTYTSTGTQISGSSVDLSASLKAASATIPSVSFTGAVTNSQLPTVLTSLVPNEGTTGTTLNMLAKPTAANPTTVIITTAGDTNAFGIVVAGAGTTGNAQVSFSGQTPCVFDGATTAGDFVQVSATVNGNCHDAGAVRPTAGKIVGRVLSTNGGAGTYNVFLFSEGTQGATQTNIANTFTTLQTFTGGENQSGTATFTGTTSVSNLNSIIYADQQAGATADVKLNACFAALPANGGTCDARGFGATAQTIAATVNVGSNSGSGKTVTLIVDRTTSYTCIITNNTPCWVANAGSTIIAFGVVANPNAGFLLSGSASVSNVLLQVGNLASNLTGGFIEGLMVRGASGATVSDAICAVRDTDQLVQWMNTTCVANSTINTVGLKVYATNAASNGITNPIFHNVQIDMGGLTGNRPIWVGCTTAGSLTPVACSIVYAVNFIGGLATHPGTGLPIATLEGSNGAGGQAPVMSINFYGYQIESSHATDIGILADGISALNISGLVASVSGSAGADVIKLSQPAGTALDGVSIIGVNNQGAWTNTINNTIISKTITVPRADYYFRRNFAAASWFSWDDASGSIATVDINGITANRRLNYVEQGAPSGVAGQDVCYGDSTAHALKCSYNNGSFANLVLDASSTYVPSNNVFTGAWDCTNVTPVTVNANVATDQNMMACTIPAGTLNRVGRTLRVKVAGVYSTPAASTSQMTLKIKLCTVSGCGSGTVISPINIQSTALGTVQITNDNFSARSELTTQTAGASSAYEAHGEYLIDLATLATAADNVFGDGNTATVGTIDSTAQLFLQCTFAFSNASASNSATQRQLIAETVN